VRDHVLLRVCVWLWLCDCDCVTVTVTAWLWLCDCECVTVTVWLENLNIVSCLLDCFLSALWRENQARCRLLCFGTEQSGFVTRGTFIDLLSDCYILSFVWFPGFWILYADVSEHSVQSP
jgi:hypothetical protein